MYVNGERVADAAAAVELGLLVDITDEIRRADVQMRDRILISRRVHDDLLCGEE